MRYNQLYYYSIMSYCTGSYYSRLKAQYRIVYVKAQLLLFTGFCVPPDKTAAVPSTGTTTRRDRAGPWRGDRHGRRVAGEVAH